MNNHVPSQNPKFIRDINHSWDTTKYQIVDYLCLYPKIISHIQSSPWNMFQNSKMKNTMFTVILLLTFDPGRSPCGITEPHPLSPPAVAQGPQGPCWASHLHRAPRHDSGPVSMAVGASQTHQDRLGQFFFEVELPPGERSAGETTFNKSWWIYGWLLENLQEADANSAPCLKPFDLYESAAFLGIVGLLRPAAWRTLSAMSREISWKRETTMKLWNYKAYMIIYIYIYIYICRYFINFMGTEIGSEPQDIKSQVMYSPVSIPLEQGIHLKQISRPCCRPTKMTGMADKFLHILWSCVYDSWYFMNHGKPEANITHRPKIVQMVQMVFFDTYLRTKTTQQNTTLPFSNGSR